jgi:uncharacterized BrkB/YihY/UPF0761 family membrane protein
MSQKPTDEKKGTLSLIISIIAIILTFIPFLSLALSIISLYLALEQNKIKKTQNSYLGKIISIIAITLSSITLLIIFSIFFSLLIESSKSI